MILLFTHKKKKVLNNKLTEMPLINININTDYNKREPINNIFNGMVFSVNNGNNHCKSCSDR